LLFLDTLRDISQGCAVKPMRCTYGESRKSLAEVVVNVRVSSLDGLQDFIFKT
jgi:hypothetical protein